jgi:peptide-methionine (R)-S-oxide reductase
MRLHAVTGCLALVLASSAGCAQRGVHETTATAPAATPSTAADQVEGDLVKTDAEWKKILSPEQFDVLRRKGTEAPFSGKYWNQKDDGTYVCAGCGTELFTSADKFDAGCGWPSYTRAMDDGRITEHVDTTHGMTRTEVTCTKCGGHLGHVFDDGPEPTGLRYCINSVSLDFKKKK